MSAPGLVAVVGDSTRADDAELGLIRQHIELLREREREILRRTHGDGGATGPTWETAVDEYLSDCRRRNLSEATLQSHRYLFESRRVERWRANCGVTHLEHLTPTTLRRLETSLTDARLKPATVATLHRDMRAFGAWGQRRFGVGGGVVTVAAPMTPVGAPTGYTDAELEQIREHCQCSRDRLIVDVLLATGVRASELCALTTTDLRATASGAWITVRQGKGRKDRIVPLDTPHEKVSARLTRYLRYERPATPSSALFVRQRRTATEYDGLCKRGLQAIMHRLSLETGLRVHAHAFRHTFATRAIGAGVNPLVVQRVLGHTTVAMTNRYVHTSPQDILEAWSRRRD